MASSNITTIPITASQVTAIILAGGQSKRMGRDKALIEVDGVPLLSRVYAVAESVCDRVLIVTDKSSQYRSLSLSRNVHKELSQRINKTIDKCKFVKDDFSEGPLVGFVQGLFDVKTTWVLLLACDLPWLDTDTVESWLSQLDRLPKGTVACLPRSEKGWEPLCGFYRASCLARLEDFSLAGGRSFQEWLAQEAVVELTGCSTDVLFNCNTPEDLARIQASGASPKRLPTG
jgi:molybdenum cofactor guanylyltransferase